jgi:hypothetical protein
MSIGSLLFQFVVEEDVNAESLYVAIKDQLMQEALYFQNHIQNLLIQLRTQHNLRRNPSLFDQRLLWAEFAQKYSHRHDF